MQTLTSIQDLFDVFSSTAYALRDDLLRGHTSGDSDVLDRKASELAKGSRGKLVFLRVLELGGDSVTLKKPIDLEGDGFNFEWKNSMRETPMPALFYTMGADKETLRMVLAEVHIESQIRASVGLDDSEGMKRVGPTSKGITWLEVKEMREEKRRERERREEREEEEKLKFRGGGSSLNDEKKKKKKGRGFHFRLDLFTSAQEQQVRGTLHDRGPLQLVLLPGALPWDARGPVRPRRRRRDDGLLHADRRGRESPQAQGCQVVLPRDQSHSAGSGRVREEGRVRQGKRSDEGPGPGLEI